MEIAVAEDVHADEQKYPTREGMTRAQFLLTCEAPDGLSFRLVRSQYQEGEKAFRTPRHHHGFQQIRLAEKGTLNYAPKEYIPEGDIAYFPRGAYYGPQHRDHGVGITVQYGFGPELPGGKDSLRVYTEGVEKLRDLGKVDAGVFIDTDPATGQERRRETWEAVAQEVTGEPYAIPAEGYDAPILMHPQAYAYFEAAPGVEVKHLGGFYDHPGPNADVRISMIRLSEGGAYTLSADRAQLVWTTSAGLQVEGRTYPELTSLYSPRDEEVEISAADGLEVYLVEFPRLD